MQGYGAQELARSFRTVRKNTITIAEEIPEEKYSFRPTPEVRSVAQTLAHIAVSPRWHRRRHADGLTFIDFATFATDMQREAAEAATLTTKAQILDVLRREGDEFASWIETLSDATLAEHVGFPPPVQPSSKARLEMLLAVKEHEMHHRAQLMLIERLLGIVPHLTRERQARMAQASQAQPQGA